MNSNLDISNKNISELSELVHLGEALVEKHLRDGAKSRMELQKIAQVKYSLSLINDKLKEAQRYRKLWLHAEEELHEVLKKENELQRNFKQSVESLVPYLNRN